MIEPLAEFREKSAATSASAPVARALAQGATTPA
jgi:hypothetical protein